MRLRCLWSMEGKERRLFYMFDKCAEAGSFRREKEDEVKAERVAGDPAHGGSFDFYWWRLVGKLNNDLNIEPFGHIDVGLGSTAGRRDVCDRSVAFDLAGRKSQSTA